MREGVFLGKKVVMSNAEWKASLRRVDVKRAERVGGKYFINAKCPFCEARTRYARCKRCPLTVFRANEYSSFGCVDLVNLVAKQECGSKRSCIDLMDDCVAWFPENDKVARPVLQALHAGLVKMKVRRR